MTDSPQHRTKYYLDYYWAAANCKKDDGTSQLTVQTMYAYPDYPLEMELKAPSVIDSIVAVHQAESRAELDAAHKPYKYDERVPVEIVTVNKQGVTDVKALQQVEAEVRRILETQPTGSKRSLEQTRPTTKFLGSTTLRSTIYNFRYERGTT